MVGETIKRIEFNIIRGEKVIKRSRMLGSFLRLSGMKVRSSLTTQGFYR